MIGLAGGGARRWASSRARRSAASSWARPAWGRSKSWRARAAPVRVSRVAAMTDAELVVSRSHQPIPLEELAMQLRVRKLAPYGSAGVKAMRIAAGESDVYCQPGRAGKKWDACAPEAIVVAAGGSVSDVLGQPIDYTSGVLDNSQGFVATNGLLHAEVLARGRRPARLKARPPCASPAHRRSYSRPHSSPFPRPPSPHKRRPPLGPVPLPPLLRPRPRPQPQLHPLPPLPSTSESTARAAKSAAPASAPTRRARSPAPSATRRASSSPCRGRPFGERPLPGLLRPRRAPRDERLLRRRHPGPDALPHRLRPRGPAPRAP